MSLLIFTPLALMQGAMLPPPMSRPIADPVGSFSCSLQKTNGETVTFDGMIEGIRREAAHTFLQVRVTSNSADFAGAYDGSWSQGNLRLRRTEASNGALILLIHEPSVGEAGQAGVAMKAWTGGIKSRGAGVCETRLAEPVGGSEQ